ncbi:MAG: DNA alkylation repair protein [Treponema sp.]|nr:DNA alkylation repair protein [Treponema sp.]
MKEILEKLFFLKDLQYAQFQSRLIPNVSAESVIGVRTPALKELAKELHKKSLRGEFDEDLFFSELPHAFFEENQLHSFLISNQKDFLRCIKEIERFLPFVNNWATCDQLCCNILKKHRNDLLPCIDRWLYSSHAYTVRFAIRLLMNYFLDDDFSEDYLSLVGSLCRTHIKNADDNYYVNMMIAWYFATALAKQWEPSFMYLKEGRLNDWCLKKTVQKACESFRVSDEHKKALRAL